MGVDGGPSKDGGLIRGWDGNPDSVVFKPLGLPDDGSTAKAMVVEVGQAGQWAVFGPDKIGLFNFKQHYPYLSESEVRDERMRREFVAWGGWSNQLADENGRVMQGLQVAFRGVGGSNVPNSFEVLNCDPDHRRIEVANQAGEWVPSGRASTEGVEEYKRERMDDPSEVFLFDDGKVHQLRITEKGGQPTQYEFRLTRTDPAPNSFPTGAGWDDAYGHTFPNSKLELKKIA